MKTSSWNAYSQFKLSTVKCSTSLVLSVFYSTFCTTKISLLRPYSGLGKKKLARKVTPSQLLHSRPFLIGFPRLTRTRLTRTKAPKKLRNYVQCSSVHACQLCVCVLLYYFWGFLVISCFVLVFIFYVISCLKNQNNPKFYSLSILLYEKKVIKNKSMAWNTKAWKT